MKNINGVGQMVNCLDNTNIIGFEMDQDDYG